MECDLLAQKLAELKRMLLPGFSPLNWTALGIHDFAAATNQARAHASYVYLPKC